MTQTYKIGIDVGGTFTDFVAIDRSGNTTICKSPSTPRDQSIGVLEGLGILADRLGLDIGVMLARTERIVHGTTVATNALLERKGSKTGLLTTTGHRDILEMREGLKPDRYNLRMAPPEPLVPRDLRRPVAERLTHDGRVLVPLDEDVLRAECTLLREVGVEAVAICFLHAYRNPVHELRAAEIVAEMIPGVYVSTSSEVLPQIKEYERLSTTVVNAYVGPIVKLYMERLKGRLSDAGYGGPLFIILSHGGVTQVADAITLAAGTCLSGPAGGIAGARACARMIEAPNVIPFDMGGTSTEVSLIADFEVALTSGRGLAGERIALRSFDILSIAAGGGSIARMRSGSGFAVGPESAGAEPGPACFGRGGTEVTVTDANLVLGYLATDPLSGGRGALDLAASAAAIDRLGSEIGLDRIATASGVRRMINIRMADGIRLMTLRRGVDPRKFTLLSFGGAAGLHAVEVAREMDIPRVVVPTVASVLSAWGMLASDLRYEITRSRPLDGCGMTDETVRGVYDAIAAEALAQMPAEEGAVSRLEYSAEMRYGEQIFEIDVPLDGIDFAAPGLVEKIQARFHARHEALFTYASPGEEVDLVNARVAVVGAVEQGEVLRQLEPARGPARVCGTRKVHLVSGPAEVAVYSLADLAPGHEIEGPALVTSETTTVLLEWGDRASITVQGWLDIAVAPKTTDVAAQGDTRLRQPATV
jgi:N-methylhydantoinase A